MPMEASRRRLLRPNLYIYKFMTLLQRNIIYSLATTPKLVKTKSVYIQIYDTVTKEYYLFPDNGAKNFLNWIIYIYEKTDLFFL